jgi:[acyl-carrier-protein] S-malonyltransferase
LQFHVTVAPSAGNFTPAEIVEGDLVRAGSAIGHVENRQGSNAVNAAHTGVLVEWLAHPGDPVAPGQPLARLHPTGVDR